MAKPKRGSKRNVKKAALALGAAGVSFAMTGGASATAPRDTPLQDNARRIFLGEEEVSDVSLSTFHIFDRENGSGLVHGIRVARGCGCGHGGGCGGGCAHAGCAHAGCGGCAHVGGCGCAAHVGCAHIGGCAHVGCARAGGCSGCVHIGGCRACRCAVHACRGCRGGCACAGAWIGVSCLGCAACSGSCWQWDPYLGRWINVCY